ncbi:MAG: hypothetical protein KA190_22315 [Kofleriaceae bacterium]|nr:hypothetical protein [Kofleriaceae bacterium]
MQHPKRSSWCALAALALTVGPFAAGCSDDAPAEVDAAAATADAAVDATSVDAGRCGADVFFTGETIDWGSSTAMFRGVFDARWTLRGQPSVTATTAPNGRIELCVPAADGVLDLDAPAQYLDGLAVLDLDLINSTTPAFFSARSFMSPGVAANFYLDEVGGPFDVAKGHVLAYAAVDVAAGLALDHPHAAEIGTLDGTTWATGAGRWTLFPNVDIGDGNAVLTGPGPTFQVAPAIPLEPGKLTFVHYVFALE